MHLVFWAGLAALWVVQAAPWEAWVALWEGLLRQVHQEEAVRQGWMRRRQEAGEPWAAQRRTLGIHRHRQD